MIVQYAQYMNNENIIYTADKLGDMNSIQVNRYQ